MKTTNQNKKESSMSRYLMIAAAFSLTNCVFSMPEEDAQMQEPAPRRKFDTPICQPSCILAWKHVEKTPLQPGDSVLYFDTQGDTLVLHLGELEDGREWTFSREAFDTIEVGDIVPGCKMEPDIACWVEP